MSISQQIRGQAPEIEAKVATTQPMSEARQKPIWDLAMELPSRCLSREWLAKLSLQPAYHCICSIYRLLLLQEPQSACSLGRTNFNLASRRCRHSRLAGLVAKALRSAVTGCPL